MQEKMLQERNINMRQQIKEGVQSKIEETQGKKREKAELVKYERQEANE